MANKSNNRKNNNGKGAGAKGKGGNNNNNNYYCDLCGKNSTHNSKDCRKRQGQNNQGGKHTGRPCKHCQGQHKDWECKSQNNGANNRGQNNNSQNDNQSKPSRPCKYCQSPDHYDSACPNLSGNNGAFDNAAQNQNRRDNQNIDWQAGWQQNSNFNQVCAHCGNAHNSETCPMRPQQPMIDQYANATELLAQLRTTLNDYPSQTPHTFHHFLKLHPELLKYDPTTDPIRNPQYQDQQQHPQTYNSNQSWNNGQPIQNYNSFQPGQRPAPMTQSPLETWANGGQNYNAAQPYSEHSLTGSGHVPGQPQGTSYPARPTPTDHDGDVMMGEWEYMT